MATSAMYFSLCDDTVRSPRVQDLVHQRYDLAFVSSICSDCYLWLVYRLKIPFVVLSPLDLLSVTANLIGNPIFSSFQLHPFLEYEHPMTFLQRTHSALMDAGGLVYMRHIYSGIEQRCRESGLCPEDMPSIVDMYRNASMTFANK
ncbi:uncharacterized protein LOC135195242 [Macrobrachium nipponense]|uniref:uncharacterized protein LOC135195242 n=1 Tax=Macrobrachium nipponense TaxID=159736 RepID=UPI0030C800B0